MTDHNEAMRLSKPEEIAQFAQQAANEGPMVHTLSWQQLSGGLLMCSNAIRDLLAERDQLRAEVGRMDFIEKEFCDVLLLELAKDLPRADMPFREAIDHARTTHRDEG